ASSCRRSQPATLGLDTKQECIPVSFSSKSRTSPPVESHKSRFSRRITSGAHLVCLRAKRPGRPHMPGVAGSSPASSTTSRSQKPEGHAILRFLTSADRRRRWHLRGAVRGPPAPPCAVQPTGERIAWSSGSLFLDRRAIRPVLLLGSPLPGPSDQAILPFRVQCVVAWSQCHPVLCHAALTPVESVRSERGQKRYENVQNLPRCGNAPATWWTAQRPGRHRL